MATTTTWVNRIIYKIKNSIDNNIEYKIEPFFDQVRYNQNNGSYTLKNLADGLETFFNKKGFMHYSPTQPADNSTTVEWYCLEDDYNRNLFND